MSAHTFHDWVPSVVPDMEKCGRKNCHVLRRVMRPAPAVVGSTTSEAAARSQPDSKRAIDKGRILAAIQATNGLGLTDDEGERITGIDGNTYRPRRGELERDNVIVKARRKRLTKSGREAEVWVAR